MKGQSINSEKASQQMYNLQQQLSEGRVDNLPKSQDEEDMET
jgi:hypothetical protein